MICCLYSHKHPNLCSEVPNFDEKNTNIYHRYFSVNIICVWPCPPPKLRNRTFQFDVHQAIMLLTHSQMRN